MKRATDWNDYYRQRIEHNKRTSTEAQLDLHVRWYKNWLRYIEKHVHIFDTSLTAFEIGSGMGGALRLLSSFGVPITGSDISSKAVQTFRNKYRSIPYIVYNIENSFVRKEKYDQVFAFEVLEHIENPSVAIKNIKKLLKKNGHFVGTTPYPYEHVIHIPTHCNVHPPSYWIAQFKKQGFSSVQTYPMSLPPYLWRIHPKLNFICPFYIPFRNWISTSLIIAYI